MDFFFFANERIFKRRFKNVLRRLSGNEISFFFFFWSEKNLNKTFSSLLLINVTNKIWKLKIFVWETLFTSLDGIINDVMRTIGEKWGSIFQKNGKCSAFLLLVVQILIKTGSPKGIKPISILERIFLTRFSQRIFFQL